MNCKIEESGKRIDPQKEIRKESWWWGVNESGKLINRSAIHLERNLLGNLLRDFVRFWDYFVFHKKIFRLSVSSWWGSRFSQTWIASMAHDVKVQHFQKPQLKNLQAHMSLKTFCEIQQKNINSFNLKQKMCWNRNKHEICMTTARTERFIRQVLANDIKCSLAYLIRMFLHGH